MQNIVHNRSSQRRGSNKSYILTTEYSKDAGRHLQVCETTCINCGKTKRIFWKKGDEPTEIARKWRDLGWDFDPYNAKCVVCPDHKRKPAAETTMQSTTANANANANVSQMKTTPKVLTSADKGRIRHLLDLHFDDDNGRYIDEYTDQRIGSDLDIPWAMIKEFREAAYGPIREDERFDQLRKEIMAVEERFVGELNRLRAKLDDLEKSYK